MPNDSPLSCGDRCDPCPKPAKSETTCIAGQCRAVCTSRTFTCNGICVDSEVRACNDRQVIVVPRAQAPARTATAEAICAPSAEADGKRADCPVLEYGNYRVWAFTYDDNQPRFLVRVFQGNTLVKELSGEGGHRLWKLIFDDEYVYFFGVDDGTDNGVGLVSWSDLPPRP
jgi:hypothetical protein